jgi:hypothetical protein
MVLTVFSWRHFSVIPITEEISKHLIEDLAIILQFSGLKYYLITIYLFPPIHKFIIGFSVRICDSDFHSSYLYRTFLYCCDFV